MADRGGVGEHRPAFLAGAQRRVGVEGADHLAQALLDVVAPEIDLVQLVAAGGTEPGDAVELLGPARPLDDEADAPRRPPRRVIDVLRQQEDLALADAHPPLAAVLDHMDEDMAVELVEDLVPRIDVEVVARVRALDDLEDEVRALEHLLVADGAEGGRQMRVDPGLKPKGRCQRARHRCCSFPNCYSLRPESMARSGWIAIIASSFPRKRESSGSWAPACAGATRTALQPNPAALTLRRADDERRDRRLAEGAHGLEAVEPGDEDVARLVAAHADGHLQAAREDALGEGLDLLPIEGRAQLGRHVDLVEPHGNGLQEQHRRVPQPSSAAITRPMKPSIAAGFIQRITATIPVLGSIQVELPPAPLAKKLSGEALG